MRLLFLENEDSFSWNVIDRLPLPRSAITLAPGRGFAGPLEGHGALVIGPGPMDPVRAGLLEVVRRAAALRLPTLGLCLGHQALGLAFGAKLVRAPPMHGKRSTVRFTGSRFFARFTEEPVMRYHSLALVEVTSPLKVVAAAADGTVMAVEHASLPMAGLQFHPDSFGTPRGEAMLASFFEGLV